MRGRCIRFDVVLHAYRHLGWDGDAQNGLPSVPQPAHRPPATINPVPLPDSFIGRLKFIDVSAPTHPNSLFTLFSHHPSHLQIQVRFRSSARCHVHLRPQTTSSRSHLRGSITAEHPSSRFSSPSTTTLRQRPHSTRANSPFLLPSCNHSKIQ